MHLVFGFGHARTPASQKCDCISVVVHSGQMKYRATIL